MDMYILALNGSPNNEGNTAFLLNKILEKCEENGADVEMISVPDAVNSAKTPFCGTCVGVCKAVCYAGTELEEAYNKLRRADAVVIGSPVYFGTVSAQLKAFFDKTRKLRGEKVLIGKPCGCVSVGTSRFGGQETTVNTMQAMALVQGMTIVGEGHSEYDAGHHGVCSMKPANDDEYAITRCEVMALRLIDEVKK